jgi:multidrug efflux pump subunit AcrB
MSNSQLENKVKNIEVTDSAGKLARGFLYNPLTAVLAVALLLIGYLSLEIMPREEDPQIAISGGSIIIPAPGLTPREVEKIIVEPLEQKLKEIKGIEHIYSMSSNNVAIVNVMYYIGQNREVSNLKIYDKVMQNMDKLPKKIMQPMIKPLDIDIDIPIVNIAFFQKNNNVDYYEYLSTIQDLKKELSTIDAVSKTKLYGDKKQQFNVDIDLGKLKGYHISIGQIAQAIQGITTIVPDVKTKTKDNKIVVFGIKNAIETIDDVGNIIIASYMGSPIYLKNVATVTNGINYQDKKSAQIIIKDKNNITTHNQITLSIAKLAGTNAVTVSNSVDKLLENKKEMLEEKGIEFLITRNYGERANEAVNELVDHLLITIVIIAVMLVFFLGWRESIIVTFTVPAILAITLFIAYMTDQTINRITLFAFLLSLGLLVDAAIIVIENIHRHLHSHESSHMDMDELVIKATDEIGAPTNVATLAIILTMVPMAFVGGMMGEFMKPIPYNVPVALLASLFIAYIFTPYLSKKLLKRESHKKEHTGENNAS